MAEQDNMIPRRRFIRSIAHTAGGLAGLAALPASAQSSAGGPGEDQPGTAGTLELPYIGMTEDGPLYPPVEIPWNSDLTTTGNGGKARGRVLYLFGVIYSRNGRPLENATVEIWHTDYNGNYKHPRGWGQDKLDPNFGYFARVRTNSEGFYLFRTIRPRWYELQGLPGTGHSIIPRAAHIHMKMRHESHGVLTTEAYFDNQSHAEVAPRDRVFLSRPRAVRDRIVLAENSPKDYASMGLELEQDAICCRYDLAFLL